MQRLYMPMVAIAKYKNLKTIVMKKEKEKERDTNDNNITNDKPKIESPKQRKGLYYLLFKGGLWQ